MHSGKKRLEQDKFKWPRKDRFSTVTLNHEQWCWLLRGFDYRNFKPHHVLHFTDVA
ncbi:IS66 family insertion sequence element accessory protein TnpB [Teredinibacter turnerae]|uniref:IS66 family insertion sequence element accessory protein TnpB n=1 Tax=Teredinibacter turnerae TaxID=2426 RepID=UPI0003FBD580